jgi:flagellar basal body-associated protein FliL
VSAKPDKKQAAPPTPEAAPEAAPEKKKPPIKTIGIVAALMIAQGVGVYMIAKMTSPKPAAADVQVDASAKSDHESFVEIPLIEEKFQNLQSGRPYIWDVSIVLKVKAKDEQFVTELLQKQANEVKEGIALIFRRAPHTQLMEAGLETLNRQIYAYLNNDVVDKDAESKPRVYRILIPKCKGFPAD